MNRSPELKPTKYDALVVLAVLLLAAVIGARTWFPGAAETGPGAAVISIDGREAERLPLSPAERTYESRGYAVTVTVTVSGVCVSHADCPTQDCVRTGTITRPGESIVCLPAHIVITLVGGAPDPGFDVAAG